MVEAAAVSTPPGPAASEAPALPNPGPPLAFDGRDVSDQADSLDVRGFSLFFCACCGTPRDARLPYCCEFAYEASPRNPTAAL
jgi:hypothetical protein